jgi:hypothetical protein
MHMIKESITLEKAKDSETSSKRYQYMWDIVLFFQMNSVDHLQNMYNIFTLLIKFKVV